MTVEQALHSSCWYCDLEGNSPPSSGSLLLRLDYISCVLSVVSTILLGRRIWTGWLLSAINCVVICVIALRTSQTGFIPANLFCLAMCWYNVRKWRTTPDDITASR